MTLRGRRAAVLWADPAPRTLDVKVGVWTLGVDPASTGVAHNWFGPGVTTPISTN